MFKKKKVRQTIKKVIYSLGLFFSKYLTAIMQQSETVHLTIQRRGGQTIWLLGHKLDRGTGKAAGGWNFSATHPIEGKNISRYMI